MKPSPRFVSPLAAALALVLVFPLNPDGRDTCKGFKNEAQRKTCYEKKYKEADYELNRVFRAIGEKLPEDHRKEMRESSRAWIQNKEYFCGFQAELENKKDPKNSGYFACLLDFTKSRATYLRQAFGGQEVTPGREGRYDDGLGGRLQLEKKPDDRLEFTIEVVRGPTAHLGEISGDFTLEGAKGRFQTGNCENLAGEQSCCKLLFDFRKYHLKITEDNCSEFHGARAYFDGEYRKVR